MYLIVGSDTAKSAKEIKIKNFISLNVQIGVYEPIICSEFIMNSGNYVNDASLVFYYLLS